MVTDRTFGGERRLWKGGIICSTFCCFLCIISDIKFQFSSWAMQNNFKAVILEDAVKDIRTAARVLSQVGIDSPTIFNDVPKAMLYLEEVVAVEKPCPNLMVVDLAFGVESGFEALRFY